METKDNQPTYSNYKKFGLMILISFILMYGIMFLNVAQSDHIYLSLTRTYMALLMVCPMALLMLTMMKKMYENKSLNRIIMVSSIAIFIFTLFLLRTQTPIADIQYMKAMIPHHSSAILASENADLSDPEVKKLSEEIIKAQKEEIAKMEAYIERLEE